MCVDLRVQRDVAALGKKCYVALFRGQFSRFMRVNSPVHEDDVAWALERSLAETRSDGRTEIIGIDCGGEYKGRFAEVCDTYLIKREFVTPGTPRLNGCVERGLAVLGVAQPAARVHAGSLLDDLKVLDRTVG